MSSGAPEWVIREDASRSVLLALYLRQALNLRSPNELPYLNGVREHGGGPTDQQRAALEPQWQQFWAMTVEPQSHPSSVPLELVDGFETLVALPATGASELAEAIAPYAKEALAFSQSAHARYSKEAQTKVAYRAYASAIAVHERQVGRRAHSFELNVQVLPLAQRGVWWIGTLTIAVTDSLRGDFVAFDAAIHPIIAELA